MDAVKERDVVVEREVDESKAVKVVEREYFHLHILDLEICSTARLCGSAARYILSLLPPKHQGGFPLIEITKLNTAEVG